MLERDVEGYLMVRVFMNGGRSYKWISPGRNNVPDRIVIWPGPPGQAKIHFVETKAPGKKARAAQAREHERLIDKGCTVLLLDTKKKIDNYVKVFK